MALKYPLAFAIAVTASVIPSPKATAADICRVKVLQNIAPVGSPEYPIRKGQYISAITQYTEWEPGQMVFCQHGGGCYPERVFVKGKGAVKALQLVNCRVIKKHGEFAVEAVRSANSASRLRQDNIEDQLIDFGMSSAGADNASRKYIKNPSGQCGRLVKSALEGNPDARRTLSKHPKFCLGY